MSLLWLCTAGVVLLALGNKVVPTSAYTYAVSAYWLRRYVAPARTSITDAHATCTGMPFSAALSGLR